MQKNKCILTIAGSDSGAGAGIQSDLKTFKNHGLYGLTVITSITAQNTLGVQENFPLNSEIVSSQLKSILSDFDISVAKTGILPNYEIIRTVWLTLRDKKKIRLVVDPVLMSKNNYSLMDNKAISALIKSLIKITYLITPNLFEAEKLTGISIINIDTLENALIKLYSYGCKNVLIKGGHFKKNIGIKPGTDVLFDGKKFYLFKAPFIKTRNTHGIGCTFSAAIASNLVLGNDIISSIKNAKSYVLKSLLKTIKVGTGIGPVEK